MSKFNHTKQDYVKIMLGNETTRNKNEYLGAFFMLQKLHLNEDSTC